MDETYIDREQTKAKHFILKNYLQELAFKVFHFKDIAYVDGFSGPWKTKTEDFSDTSFMIAIRTLQDAQNQYEQQSGVRRKIRCFFCENNLTAFKKLETAVKKFDNPRQQFEIKTVHSAFEDAIPEIQNFIGEYFPLIFIDPTGWSGYPFDKIKPLLSRHRCEVLINFMYDHINRFSNSDDPAIIESLNPILGGSDWRGRLDPKLSRGLAVEKLFRDTLKLVGNFKFVVSTKIDKSTVERPHFFLAYGTKNYAGLKAFRDTEYRALKRNFRDRANAKGRDRELKTGSSDLFRDHDAEVQAATIDEIVADQKVLATKRLLEALVKTGQLYFPDATAMLLQEYMLREPNVKDICVQLAKADMIDNSWGRNRKPDNNTLIRLRLAN